jgi:hypothetical protein
MQIEYQQKQATQRQQNQVAAHSEPRAAARPPSTVVPVIEHDQWSVIAV